MIEYCLHNFPVSLIEITKDGVNLAVVPAIALHHFCAVVRIPHIKGDREDCVFRQGCIDLRNKYFLVCHLAKFKRPVYAPDLAELCRRLGPALGKRIVGICDHAEDFGHWSGLEPVQTAHNEFHLTQPELAFQAGGFALPLGRRLIDVSEPAVPVIKNAVVEFTGKIIEFEFLAGQRDLRGQAALGFEVLDGVDQCPELRHRNIAVMGLLIGIENFLGYQDLGTLVLVLLLGPIFERLRL